MRLLQDVIVGVPHQSLTAHIPILAVSANAAPGDIERGLEAGFFDYVTKPIRVARFMQSVNAALAHAASQKAQ